MLSAAGENPAATAFAVFGAICLATWPLFPTRRGMLLAQMGIGIGFGMHYALWGSSTAAAVNGMGALQTAAALVFGVSPRLRWIGYALILTTAGASVITWSGLPSVLAATGQTLIGIGRMQTAPSAMRILVLAGVPFWIVHDLLVGSPLVAANLLSLAVGCIVELRRPALREVLRVSRRGTSGQTCSTCP